MSHSHNSHISISTNKMWLMTAITFTFCLIEALSGYLSNSLALMADAGHNFADAFALGLSAFAMWIAKKPANNKLTFGYHRIGIMVALANAISLVIMAIAIFWAALEKLKAPEPVHSVTMIWMALLAIILNAGIGIFLHSSSKHDLNIRSAYLHMIGDALASLGVVIAGIIILLTKAYIADPIVSIIFAVLVLCSSWGIIKEAIHTLLETTPAHIELDKVRKTICSVVGVLGTHDLHVWTISSGLIACSCHIRVIDQNVSNAKKMD